MARSATPLPEPAVTYIQSLTPTHKKSSLNGHRVTLRKFHKWLGDHDVRLGQVTREHLCAWLVHLHDAGLAPKTLNHHIIFIRLYLRWLQERGMIRRYPDDLIRTSDMVKEPKYLPRPLPPDADRMLQERLANDGDIYSLGLLLMRKTGIRNGELRDIEAHCIRLDHLGNHFLKVPLGKLNSERLVPIDDDTCDLIRKLKGDDPDKVFLIETARGKKTRYVHYQKKIKRLCEGLQIDGNIGTHRLRHTFATSLLDAGMSLVGIMKLLGHTDHRMTLRYADISQQAVGDEYFKALDKLENQYQIPMKHCASLDSDPVKMIDNLKHIVTRIGLDHDSTKTYTRSLVKKLNRIQSNIRDLLRSVPNPSKL